MNLSNCSVGIIGLGQMGGSLALRLSQVYDFTQIAGLDQKRDLVDAAISVHAIGKTYPTAENLVEESDVVIIALPIAEILRLL